MPRSRRSALCLLALLVAGAHAAAQVLPSGFVAEPIASGWQSPVGLAFVDESHLLVAERDGRVFYVVGGAKQAQPVYDIASETLVNGDRGLLGIAPHPAFDPAAGGWLYLLYVVDTGAQPDRAQLAYSRVVRVMTEVDGSGDLVALPDTREYLLGDTWSTGIASCHLSHTIGSLRFLSDGSLVLTTGDNAHYDATDAGGLDPHCFDPGRTPADQDVGAYRSQYDDTLCGKVVRLDAETGLGLADNPFFTGDPAALLSRVYARGLRNPFRFTTMPGSGEREALFISDVGWNVWEEIELALGGENFGWPCFEGAFEQGAYQDADVHGLCDGVDATHAAPLLAWHHSQNQAGFRGNCASGLCVYTGTRYPEIYRGRLFFSDYGRNWMRAAALDEDLRITGSIGFGSQMNGPVDLVAQPGTGDLVYASISTGVFRLRYLGGALPPSAVATATPEHGPGDLDVLLSAAGSSDPEGQDLAYAWEVDGVHESSAAEFQRLFTGEQNYAVRLTVTDTEGLSDSTDLVVRPNNTPPVITAIQTPADASTYVSGLPIEFAAEATDAEDGTPAAVWSLDLVHDHHEHPDWATSEGLVTEITPDTHGPGDNHFRARLRVTDSRGASDERVLALYDRGSLPQAHLVDLVESRVRAGQELAPVGHVDWAYGLVAPRQARLVWDWGDGTQDAFEDARHHADTMPRHAYARPGRYALRLVAELGDWKSVASAEIEVVPARAAVAVFAPLANERWVPAEEQTEIVEALALALAPYTSDVRSFTQGEGAQLAEWMEPFLADRIADVLVLLDFLPSALVAGGYPGSLLERWIASGNALVWTGFTPFLAQLEDDGRVVLTTGAAEEFFGASEPGVVLGSGLQQPTALGASVLPSFVPYRSGRALRYDLVGPEWTVARIFAVDIGHDSDAIELRRGRGTYAQFHCDPDGQPRPAVLTEYLLDKLVRGRTGAPTSPPVVR